MHRRSSRRLRSLRHSSSVLYFRSWSRISRWGRCLLVLVCPAARAPSLLCSCSSPYRPTQRTSFASRMVLSFEGNRAWRPCQSKTIVRFLVSSTISPWTEATDNASVTQKLMATADCDYNAYT